MGRPNTLDQQVAGRLRELAERGNKVLTTHTPNPPNVIGFPTLDSGQFMGWRTQALAYLRNVFGDSHTYPTSFASSTDSGGHTSEAKRGAAILTAAAEDVEQGFIQRIKVLVTSDVFADLLDQAGHLLEAGYKDPCAMLTGAVLEDGLRKLAAAQGVKVKERDDLTSLNSKCAEAGVYSRLVQKKVNVWIDIRNRADHAKFQEYADADVEAMLQGVTAFLSEHLAG